MRTRTRIGLGALTLGAGVALCAPAFGSEPRELIFEFPVSDPRAIVCLIIFLASYLLVVSEDKTRLRKAQPVMLGAGIIWALIALGAPEYGVSQEQLRIAVFHDLDEYGSLALFLIAAMTYIAALQHLNVFTALRTWLVTKEFTYRGLFWVTGLIAFFLSAIADNLTTALLMGAVVLTVGASQAHFIGLSMVNIVSAANAGGSFSPFGDITTLMVWQSGRVEFFEFLALFVPAAVTYLLPAAIMSLFVPAGAPSPGDERVAMLRGAKRTICLGVATIAMAVGFEQFLGLPPFMGMMTGLSLLMLHAYFLRRTQPPGEPDFDFSRALRAVDWDTLLFFFGVMFSVGGLAFIGYLELASGVMYGHWGATVANISMGLASAVIDNIPIMFSVLSMRPEMDQFQWLLLTLTCGVGGSLLSIGSAAGVALMGTTDGKYTFVEHLRWTPVLALGYTTGIATHFLVNA